MRSLCLGALVALLAITAPMCSAFELGKRPWFCHGLDCPKYEVVDTTDSYEVRHYDEGENKLLLYLKRVNATHFVMPLQSD
jgi:hypothetical protein